jgi:ABC-type branched-subunit amino acid transport system substrate-binding protein
MMAMAAGASLSAQAADVVKVGFLTTLSGPASAPGVDEREGFMLAMKMLGNKLGGCPPKSSWSMTSSAQTPPSRAQTASSSARRSIS